MKKASTKIFRDNFDNMVTNQYRKLYPHFEFEHKFRRLPLYPKVVLYSNVPSVEKFVEQLLPTFRFVNPKATNQTDETFTKNVVRDIAFDQKSESVNSGVIVHGFPFNASQALLLDRYLNGVNLALHVKGQSQSQQYASLLEYYNVRGTLLEIDHQSNLDAAQIETLQQKIALSMKSDL